MCLFSIIGDEPKVAEEDIVVYKMLDTFVTLDGGTGYRTPYYNYYLSFNKRGSVTMRAKMRPQVYGNGVQARIERGIHAFRKEAKASNVASQYIWTHVFKAVIPAGTRYYEGDTEDIVADKMIVFRDEDAYGKYKGAEKKG